MAKHLFRPGRTIGTVAALQVMEEAGQDPYELLSRHVTGDWGDAPEDIKQDNETSVRRVFTTNRPQIFSAYTLNTGLAVWICTEADRSVTSFLLPQEYELAKTQMVGPMRPLDSGSTQDLNNDSDNDRN